MSMSSKKRKVCRQVFSRLHNALLPLFDAEAVDITAIMAKFQVLESKYQMLTALNDVVSEELCDTTEDSAFEEVLVAESNTCSEYDEKYHTMKLKVEGLIHTPPSIVSATSDSDKKAKMKFPKIQFRSFNGEISQWIGFWSQFKSVHMDNSFSDEEKFQYLIQATKAGTKARALVDSFPPSAENYEKAINQLKTRFGRDELLIEHYVRELLGLVLLHATSKSSLTLTQLSDRLETQLLALESLGVTSEKYACMLYPLVESALPEDVLRDWERCRKAVGQGIVADDGSVSGAGGLMDKLRSFLKSEVESEERVSASRNTFVTPKELTTSKPSPKKLDQSLKVATAADLVSLGSAEKRASRCVFCDSLDHTSEFCSRAREMTCDDKYKLLRSKKMCFRCLAAFHGTRRCSKEVCCLICSKGHCTAMCRGPGGGKKVEEQESFPGPTKTVEHSYSNLNCAPVLMQTLKVRVKGDTQVMARLMIDTGSQHSYITRRLADKMKYEPLRVENLVHALFGGATTKVVKHKCYRIRLQSMSREFSCNFEALDSENICHAVPAIPKGPWLSELKQMNIPVTDTEQGAVDILVGSDIAGRFFTGKKHVLSCGLVALETSLGWTIMGRLRQEASNYMLSEMTMCSLDLSPSDIWRLDVIGIEDPADVSTKEEARTAAQEHFLNTVKILDDGRYEVSLPWLIGHPALPRNFKLASARLKGTLKRLSSSGLLAEYDAVFHEWLRVGIIEEVPVEDWDSGHYLPHRAVVKEGSTTRIRPVFDASAHEKDQPNLNQCLEKGDNLIELIPSMLLRFRLRKIAVIADIRKAFLQISVDACDRDALRFLWNDSSGNLMIYRHRRVVFGVTSSPYLLGAVIGHHLSRCSNRVVTDDVPYSESTISKLKKCLYVDNCVTSLDEQDTVMEFMVQAKAIFLEAQFDLRGWEWSDASLTESTATPVLGVLWDRKKDVLKVNPPSFQNFDEVQITRRSVLSAAQKVFDPVGICSPAILIPKLIIQDSWVDGGTWDTPLKENSRRRFLKWMSEVSAFNEIEMPRWIKASLGPGSVALHTYCDASQNSYAAVSFLRVESGGSVFVTLVGAKSRVAPLKRVTIPRLELLAAVIGARLASSIVKEVGEVSLFFWSDSSTALSWIRREEPWGVFVFNRVREIRSLTQKGVWRHVPGTSNPADLVSRGCSPGELLESRWWEGPDWLRRPPDEWPVSRITSNEDEVLAERRKTAVVTVTCPREFNSACLDKFSKYSRVVRLVGWMLRYLFNRFSKKPRMIGNLHIAEVERAEKVVLRMIQEESFDGVKDKTLCKLKPQIDSAGLIRLRTKIWARRDTEEFRAPVILPPGHDLVSKMILELHQRNGHVVGQTLLSIIRERFWVVRGRQLVKHVVAQCGVCQRFMAKSLEVETPPLPETRVRDANVFEVCGTDLAGPLYLANGDKVWICLFTCAVYRAVHLEIVTSQSTEAFMLAFRRFVAVRGRPSIIYSDNGRNFRGASNALKEIDWDGIAAQGTAERIEWRFNPPRAAWWGGFWERMIGVLKTLLRRMLGRASLNYEELCTVAYECATYVNQRPLTYLSEDPSDPIPVSPHMFLQELPCNGLPDCDVADSNALKKRIRYRLRLKEELKWRFRTEYLGQLLMNCGGFKDRRGPLVGEVVIIGSDNVKRVNWPLAVIVELLKGQDGKCRAVKLKTAKGVFTRAIQHVYPLEIRSQDMAQDDTSDTGCKDAQRPNPDHIAESGDLDNPMASMVESSPLQGEGSRLAEKIPKPKTVLKDTETRCGRKVKLPVRYAI